MKVIPKYYVGGVTVDIPMGFPTMQAAYKENKGKDSNSSEGGSNKTLVEQIFDPKAKILASDAVKMQEIAQKAGQMEGNPAFQYLSRPQQFAAIYGEYITYISKAQENYESLKEAKSELLKKGSAYEAAITSEGLLFVHKNGEQEISLIDPRTFNPGKDISVTNAELTYLRANDPRFAFDTKLLATVTEATSLKEIRQIIDDATQRLKGQGVERMFFVNPLNPQDDTALQALKEAHITAQDLQTMDLGTLLSVKIKDSDNIERIEHALNAIMASLTPQQKGLLTLRAKQFGGKASPETIIIEYLSTMREQSKSITLDFENTYSSGNQELRARAAEERKQKGVLDNMQMSDPAAFMAGYGYMEEHRFSNGSRGNIIITGNEMPITKGNQNLGRVNLSIIASSNFAGNLDLQNVTIGDTHIDTTKRSNVLVEAGALVKAALPIDQEALAQGVIKPDLEACTRLQQAWKEIKQAGIVEPTQNDIQFINETLAKHNLPAMFVSASNGVPVIQLTQYRYFGVADGFVDEAALPNGGTWNAALEPLADEDANVILKEFKAQTKGYVGKKSGFLGINEHPIIYRGTIFIPLKSDMNNAYAGSGIHPTVAQRENMARREIHKNRGPRERTEDRYNVHYD